MEISLLSLLPVGVGAWVRPVDPFWLSGQFPWPVLGPVLVALRYGAVRGLFASGVVLLLLAAGDRLGRFALEGIPGAYAVGLLFLTLAAGEFRDAWGRRLERAEARAEELQAKLHAFSRVYQLLRASHDRLEQRCASGPPPLRDLIGRLRTLKPPAGTTPLSGLGPELLGLLSSSCGLLSAAVLSPPGAGAGPRIEATLGEPGDVAKDPLIQRAIDQGELVYVTPELAEVLRTELVAAAPLLDARGTLVGVLAVRQIRFFAFHDDTLRLLSILCGHFADLVSRQLTGPQSDNLVFLDELRRTLSDLSSGGPPAALVTLRARGQTASALLSAALLELRTSDVRLDLPEGAGSAHVVLARLSGPDELRGLEDRLRALFGEEPIQVDTRPITAHDDEATLALWLHDTCGLHDTPLLDPLRPPARAVGLGRAALG